MIQTLRFKLTIEDTLWSRLEPDLFRLLSLPLYSSCMPSSCGTASRPLQGGTVQQQHHPGFKRGSRVSEPHGWRAFLRKKSGKQKPKTALESTLLLSRFLSKITFQMSVTLRELKPTKHIPPKPLLCLLQTLTPNYLLSPGVCTPSMQSLKSARWAWLSQRCQQQLRAQSSRSASRVANSRDRSDQLTEESRSIATNDMPLKAGLPNGIY